MKMNDIQKMILAGLLLALALVLPFFTGSVQFLGQRFLPMHLPILICGFICGPKYGGLIGLIAPLLRSLMFAMPPLYPVALAMSLELATYGFVVGFIYQVMKKNLLGIYLSLIIAMLLGRIVLGAANVLLLGIEGNTYAFSTFIGAAFVDALPGIIVQLIAVPAIVFAIHRYQENEQTYES